MRSLAAGLLCLLLGTAGRAKVIEFRGIRIDAAARTIRFQAQVNMDKGALEYLLVTDTGKTHESLLSTKVAPYDIQVAMLLVGIKPTLEAKTEPPAQINAAYLRDAPPLPGYRISIFLDWDDGHGPRHARAEDWLWNSKAHIVAQPGPWTYNGSEVYDGRFLAQVEGSIASLVRDAAALVNNPRPGNDDDQTWEPRANAIPAIGTPVDVTIQLEEIAK